MRATVIHGPGDIRVEEVPDPEIRLPGDAVVKVVAACVCGSDLWPYRGVIETASPRRIGHEFVGVVEEVGSDVTSLRTGQFVIAPFALSDNTCAHCRYGVHTSCASGAWWGGEDEKGLQIDGGQGEYVRVPVADGTLVATPETPEVADIPSLLTLSDVMGTGHHAAIAAAAAPGRSVVVVGDGATDIVEKRGDEGVAQVKELLGGLGADAVLECVGTKESMQQAIDATRPGGRVGYVGVPAGGSELPIKQLFRNNVSVGGGVAPVRAYLEELLADTLAGAIDPGRVFDLELPLDEAAEAYAAMDQRRSIKTMLRP